MKCRNVPDPTLLFKLCTNCARLTDVSLYDATPQAMEAVLAARHRELRRLELGSVYYITPDRLAARIEGCVRLESLSLKGIRPVGDCLPRGGLAALRHFSLANCDLTDTDLVLLVERQPGLETVNLAECRGYYLSQSGLEPLCRLPVLRSLTLVNVLGVSDWLLEQLSKAPLTELTLGGDRVNVDWRLVNFWRDVTAEGLLRLTKNCPALRWATLWDKCKPETKRTLECQTEMGKQELIRIFEEHRTRDSFMYCRLGGAPADRL